MDQTTLNQIARIIEEASICKSAYFWTPGSTAAQRRRNEQRHNVESISWTEGGHTYQAAYKYYESCSHVYACGIYYRDRKRTTIVSIRNSYRRLLAAANEEE